MTLIDKDLRNSIGYGLTTTGDFNIVENENSILSAAQNRILSEAGSWIFDEDFGSLLKELAETPIQLITDYQVKGYVELAIKPMIDDSRIIKVISTKITDRDSDSIQVEIKLELDRTNGELNINIPL